MICRKCLTKIDGESSGRLINDVLEFYHPECAPSDGKEIDPKTLERITKGVVKVIELLGCHDADRVEGVDYHIRIRGIW